tara:strand:- start:10524 stop:10649 length:126 start_codon:yes stop_codon:yes gene_type:complete
MLNSFVGFQLLCTVIDPMKAKTLAISVENALSSDNLFLRLF